MDEIFRQSKKLFDLPTTEKMKLLRNEKHRGYTPLFDQALDPKNQVHAIGDYKEGYYIGCEVPEDDPNANKPFFVPNIWPDSDLLPGWRQIMEKYDTQALEVGRVVARIIALTLKLDANFLDKPNLLGKPLSLLQCCVSLAQVSDPLKGISGASAHSDFGRITLLAIDDVVSLQIYKDKEAIPQRW
ncbi:hypothetical protein RND81_06G008000 [Saponaria officinalis]|uniref:Non-haem dioxygenase N-terminal domain-containing protein n=1 Tax=Saponaria officinalis TaxID=3572 RepID=A0AAW1K7B4_SAPOF